MQVTNDILSLLEAKGAQVARESQRAVILQPGALGDCVLTLPLVKTVKEALGLGGVDIIGHTDYVGIFPERTAVNSIRSLDATDLHRLFVESSQFDLADGDPLIHVFAEYSWIISFLGEPDGHFEQNLIFTANCSHSAEVVALALKPPQDASRHVAQFYVDQLAGQLDIGLPTTQIRTDERLIKVTEGDRDAGVELLDQNDVDVSRRLAVIHPGSGGRHKCWHAENFLAIARCLQVQEIEVVFLLGPAETSRIDSASHAAIRQGAHCLCDLSLTQVVGLLSSADTFIGNDCGVTHLAAAMGVRTVALFGPTDPALYRPIGPAVTVFRDQTKDFADRPSRQLQRTVLDALAPD
jgi:ADP-heptose:LPS heptosyltransferase